MAKIMLVEDDNNLREIYAARLQAEGHEIVAARDGEEALALAVKEKPELIISDVMMPRISGFDMLDILRNAPETKDTKVIMMTALSQAEDKSRADKLGADRYLVKSQVTLEDVASVVREVLEGRPPAEAPAPEPNLPLPVNEPAPAPAPVVAAPVAPAQPDPPIVAAPVAPAPQPDPVAVAPPQPVVIPQPTPTPAPPAPVQPTDPVVAAAPTPPATPVAATDTSTLEDDPLRAIAEELARSQEPAPSTAPIFEEVETSAPAPVPAASVPETATPPINVELPSPPQAAPEPIVEPPVVPPPVATAPEIESTPEPEQSTVKTNNNTSGMRVIQPISDPLAKPDLNKLLADEERMAAVQNPTANTVVTPEGSATPANEPPKNNDLNNIAL